MAARSAAFVAPAGEDPGLESYVTTVQWFAESNADWGDKAVPTPGHRHSPRYAASW